MSLRTVDIAAAVLLVPVALYVFHESGRWPVPPELGDPTLIPRAVATVLLLAALHLAARALTGRALPLASRLSRSDRARVLRVALLTGAYVVGLDRLGFLAATVPYVFGFGAVLGERRWARLAAFAVVVPAAAFLIFDQLLHVPLPRGWLR